ncbi:MAG: BREX-1 system phosphatase PglZ type A, partial [Desulfobacterales bacterium]|nr:BREX-1 system phosphatase PglZ type A [Desulfobacterales bacterium]
FHEPAPEDDWLLDIRLYSHNFHADKASIILNELNLDNQSIRPYLKERNTFFNNKDRFSRLKKLVKPDDSEEDIDLKMLAVITKADQLALFSILMKLFESMCHDNTFDETETSIYWTEIEKLDLRPSFWKFVAQTFGYINETGVKLLDFIIRLFVTDFSNQLKGELPASLEHFLIKSPSYAMNASVFLSQWRTNMNQFKQFNLISYAISQKLKIQDVLNAFQVEDILEVMSFEVVERRIISELRDQIVKNGISSYNDI